MKFWSLYNFCAPRDGRACKWSKLSALHVHQGSVSLSVVGGSAVLTRNFKDEIGSEVGRTIGLRFGEKVL